MAVEVLDMQDRLRQRIGRPSRVRSIAIRFTEDEARELEKEATARGTTVREWARESLLRETRRADEPGKVDPLLAEIVGVRLLLVNLLGPLASGQEPLTEPHLQAVFDQVKKAKHQVALDIQRGAK